MTAFARQEQTIVDWQLSWEIRSVNHRYFDLSLCLPESYRHLETPLRAIARDFISRGKVNATLLIHKGCESDVSIHVNHSLVTALMRVVEDLNCSLKQPAPVVDIMSLLRWPGMVTISH